MLQGAWDQFNFCTVEQQKSLMTFNVNIFSEFVNNWLGPGTFFGVRVACHVGCVFEKWGEYVRGWVSLLENG